MGSSVDRRAPIRRALSYVVVLLVGFTLGSCEVDTRLVCEVPPDGYLVEVDIDELEDDQVDDLAARLCGTER